jgi:hypothetical protein
MPWNTVALGFNAKSEVDWLMNHLERLVIRANFHCVTGVYYTGRMNVAGKVDAKPVSRQGKLLSWFVTSPAQWARWPVSVRGYHSAAQNAVATCFSAKSEAHRGPGGELRTSSIIWYLYFPTPRRFVNLKKLTNWKNRTLHRTQALRVCGGGGVGGVLVYVLRKTDVWNLQPTS